MTPTTSMDRFRYFPRTKTWRGNALYSTVLEISSGVWGRGVDDGGWPGGSWVVGAAWLSSSGDERCEMGREEGIGLLVAARRCGRQVDVDGGCAWVED